MVNLNATLKSTHHIPRAEAALRATEASFEAILDDILGIYSSGHILVNHHSTNTSIQATYESYKIGKPIVHCLTLLLNLVIVTLITIAAIRTRFWRDLPKYDILDFKSTVTAASFGGKDISKKVLQQYEGSGRMWTADSGDRKVGEIKVCLRQTDSEEPRLIRDYDGLLSQTDGDGDGIEMDEGSAHSDPDLSYKGATTVWTPVGENDGY